MVGLLYDGPIGTITLGVGRHLVSKVPALGHLGRGVGTAASRGIELVDLDVSATSLLASAEWQKVQQEAAEAVDLLADLHRGGLP